MYASWRHGHWGPYLETPLHPSGQFEAVSHEERVGRRLLGTLNPRAFLGGRSQRKPLAAKSCKV